MFRVMSNILNMVFWYQFSGRIADGALLSVMFRIKKPVNRIKMFLICIKPSMAQSDTVKTAHLKTSSKPADVKMA